jgi:hypothetical protein
MGPPGQVSEGQWPTGALLFMKKGFPPPPGFTLLFSVPHWDGTRVFHVDIYIKN